MAEGWSDDDVGHHDSGEIETNIEEDEGTAIEEGPSQDPEDKEASDDEERYEAERRRNGKQPAPKRKKRWIRAPSKTIVIRETIQVPFASLEEDEEYRAFESESDSSTSLVDSEEEDERIAFPNVRVVINGKKEAAMKSFKDKKLKEEFRNREKGAARCRMHHVVHYPSIDALRARKTFTEFISRIKCAWLVNMRVAPVPQLLACDFFTTFQFHVTTDLDVECISFRLYGVESFALNKSSWLFLFHA